MNNSRERERERDLIFNQTDIYIYIYIFKNVDYVYEETNFQLSIQITHIEALINPCI